MAYKDAYDKLLKAESKIKEQEDWINRLLEYIDYQDKQGYKEFKGLGSSASNQETKKKPHRRLSFMHQVALDLMGIYNLI